MEIILNPSLLNKLNTTKVQIMNSSMAQKRKCDSCLEYVFPSHAFCRAELEERKESHKKEIEKMQAEIDRLTKQNSDLIVMAYNMNNSMLTINNLQKKRHRELQTESDDLKQANIKLLLAACELGNIAFAPC